MTEPYVSDDNGYRDRYVALLDILGFSDLTAKADGHPNWRAWLRECISALNTTLPTHVETNGFRFAQFSDTIVMSAYRSPQGLLSIIGGCTMLTTNMLNRGILLRGGVAAGNFHHDERMMFGPALIRAHSHDKRGAPPHIALDPSVLEDMKPSLLNPSFLEWVSNDPWDLSPMLHTLIRFGSYDGMPVVGGAAMDREAFTLARNIQTQASDMSHAPAVRAKWRWQQDYWNRTVSEKSILQLAHPEPDWDARWIMVQQAEQQRLAAYNSGMRSPANSPLPTP